MMLILQKLTRDAHARFGSASVGTVSFMGHDRADILIHYAGHPSDTFVAVREDGWRIAMPL